MQAEPDRPFAVVLCGVLIHLAARIVPAADRGQWTQEWLGQLWSEVYFLRDAGAWNWREAWRLLHDCAAAFLDAGQRLAEHHDLPARVQGFFRSPWTCLAFWTAAILVVSVLSSNLPAMRALFNISAQRGSSRLLFIWLHPVIGADDKGLPSDLAPAWARSSHFLKGAAGFTAVHEPVQAPGVASSKVLVIHSEPALMRVLGASPVLGWTPPDKGKGVLLTYRVWTSLFRGDPNIIGRPLRIGGESYHVTGVLGRDFHFLTRQPALYILEPYWPNTPMMAVARSLPNVTLEALDRELTHIAEVSCYYYFPGQLRYQYLDEARWIPVRTFAAAACFCGLLAFAVSGFRIRRLRAALAHPNRAALIRRSAFYAAKTTLALSFVFLAGLEGRRSDSAILFGSQDPANGPLLLWLYVVGCMAVLFWSIADQRARCRECLRLLCFPVRIGCPGCLLLDWSGTELLCSQGHGLLHVPELAPSWEDESERWITLDESWKDLFEPSGSGREFD